MNDINSDLRARVDAFTEELAGLVRRAALQAVQQALSGHTAEAPRAARARGPKPAAKTAAKAAPKAAPVAKAAAPSRPGQKRDPKLLQKLVERLAAHIVAKPGLRIEQINKALGVPTKDLNLPIKKLLRANRITAKGQKRSTTYWPK